MTELKRQNGGARPGAGRAFLKRRQLVLPNLSTQLAFWSLLVAGLALDLWSKSVVFGWLKQKPGNSVSIIDGFLRLVMALNQGAAFGIATGKHELLAGVSFVALIIIIAVFLFGGSRQKLVHIALALFGAGICGNLWDRLFNHGQVRDFIDVYYRDRHWPAFNLADSMLCIGVGLLVLSSFWVTKRTA